MGAAGSMTGSRHWLLTHGVATLTDERVATLTDERVATLTDERAAAMSDERDTIVADERVAVVADERAAIVTDETGAVLIEKTGTILVEQRKPASPQCWREEKDAAVLRDAVLGDDDHLTARTAERYRQHKLFRHCGRDEHTVVEGKPASADILHSRGSILEETGGLRRGEFAPPVCIGEGASADGIPSGYMAVQCEIPHIGRGEVVDLRHCQRLRAATQHHLDVLRGDFIARAHGGEPPQGAL